jgi:hypothetical protein
LKKLSLNFFSISALILSAAIVCQLEFPAVAQGHEHQHPQPATQKQQEKKDPASPSSEHSHHNPAPQPSEKNAATASEKQSAMPAAHNQHSETLHPGHNAHSSAMLTTISGGPFRSMNAIGSGTALQPASTPMYGWHWMPGEWMIMLHAELKVGFNHQGGRRGVGKANSQNWAMLMAERNLWRGRMMLRGMMTAEPLTAPHGGFPQLFQTGETYRKRPIIDAQHPHDLLMELAASYTLPVSERASIHFYGGPVAEPALGPVAFMHRASAMENPAVPLAHHWQDSTHITHGVITGGLTYGRFRIEASGFHGKEPDEKRAGIELGSIDSWSWRFSFMPSPNWTAQYSMGRLSNPEFLHTGNVVRRTASLMWNQPLRRGNIASTVVWGRNSETHGVSNSYLLESTLRFRDKNYAYIRGELLDKQGLLEDNIFGRSGVICLRVPQNKAAASEAISKGILVNPATSPAIVICTPDITNTRSFAPRFSSASIFNHGGLPQDPSRVYPSAIFNRWFRVGAFTLGGVRDLVSNHRWRLGLGADLTLYHQPPALNLVYGKSVKSYQVFLRLRSGEMK